MLMILGTHFGLDTLQPTSLAMLVVFGPLGTCEAGDGHHPQTPVSGSGVTKTAFCWNAAFAVAHIQNQRCSTDVLSVA